MNPTVPATNDGRESSVRIKQASQLVLALMEHGMSPAEAIGIATARANETTRLSALELAL